MAPAKLEVRSVRYSFPVGLFHSRLHAGLSRRTVGLSPKRPEGFIRTERSDHTLTSTAIVNEAWIRLASPVQPDFRDRGHFFALAAEKMF